MSGHFSSQPQNNIAPNKTFIKQRLSWVMTSYPAASPSRATLQSVNDFLFKSATTYTEPHLSQLSISKEPSMMSVLALFQSLAGSWDMHRKITNFHQEGFAGDLKGTALFQIRAPTSDDAEAELLNIENGTFKATTGLEFQASRRWIWRLHPAGHDTKNEGAGTPKQVISIHFVKLDGETEDYLYNELEFQHDTLKHEDEAEGQKVMTARADHPCDDDFYKSVYRMKLAESDELVVEKFVVEHQVEGPSKDYISTTWYTRTPPGKD
jgi:tRNA A64-2'-O-ribosylphosphate transferase